MTDAAQNKRPPSKILVDGGDPAETAHIKELLGFVDGQTTNPSLIAKNPEVKHLVDSGHTLTDQEEAAEYRKIVQAISPLVGDAGVSIEVFADLNTTADEMLKQARDMNSWIPNAYIKYPCTAEGLKAAQRSVAEGIRVNMTLCFSQQQAAARFTLPPRGRVPEFTYRHSLDGSTTLGRTASISFEISNVCSRVATATSGFWLQASATCNTFYMPSISARNS